MLAETHAKLGGRDKALHWVAAGLELPIKTLYDQQAHGKLIDLFRALDARAAEQYVAAHAGDKVAVVS